MDKIFKWGWRERAVEDFFLMTSGFAFHLFSPFTTLHFSHALCLCIYFYCVLYVRATKCKKIKVAEKLRIQIKLIFDLSYASSNNSSLTAVTSRAHLFCTFLFYCGLRNWNPTTNMLGSEPFDKSFLSLLGCLYSFSPIYIFYYY